MIQSSPIYFRIIPKDPGGHLYAVSCTVIDPDPQGQRVSLPAWIPGSYMIREFAKHVVQLWATSEAGPLQVRKLDKSTWQCAPCRGPLVVYYEIYAWDLSVRGAYLDTAHAFFNGTSVFMRVHGREKCPQQVYLERPASEVHRGWRVATTLPRVDAPPYDFGTYAAPDYDELIDHPVVMGDFTFATYYAGGVPHDVAITGRHHTDMERLCGDLALLCEHQIGFFGEPAPFQRYLFLITAVGEGHGGLEHRTSSSLLCSRDDLPYIHQSTMTDKYRGFLGLVSHEYFHAWNVKRIRPQAFLSYELAHENYTRDLWFYEGCTSYYQNLFLVRSGLITSESYLELVAQLCTALCRNGGRLKQSLAESSFDAWIKFYKQDENAPNAIVNYYTKGALVALALDLLIRRETQSVRSLDDVMRAMWKRYGKTAQGVPEDGIEQVAAEIAGFALHDFFDNAIRGTSDLPLAQILADFDIKWELRPAESDADLGGRQTKDNLVELAQRPTLGVKLSGGSSEARLMYVYECGAAHRAGLAANDILVALDGLKVTRGNLDSLLRNYRPGETVALHAFRRDELLSFQVILQTPSADTVVLSLVEAQQTDNAGRARCRAWLSGA